MIRVAFATFQTAYSLIYYADPIFRSGSLDVRAKRLPEGRRERGGEVIMKTPGRGLDPRVCRCVVGKKVATDSALGIGGDGLLAPRHSLIGVKPFVQQLENNNRKRKEILSFTKRFRFRLLLPGFWRDIAGGVLMPWNKAVLPLDGKAIAIHNDN